jgi:hypothetical protein
MKKSVLLLMMLMMTFSFVVSADVCDLKISLINQDPYPAVQDDYVKLVFQIDGISSNACGTVEFELLEKYPISLDDGQQAVYKIESGTYTKDFQNFFMATYKARVSVDALDGENPIEVRYTYGAGTIETKEFNLEVQNVMAEFEIFVSDYDNVNKELMIDVLNIGMHGVQALTMEIPKQDGIVVKGSNIKIVGDIDSNEDSSADYEATVKDGTYKIILRYSDEVGERRTVEKEFAFVSENFADRVGDSSSSGISGWLVAIVVAIVLFVGYRFVKKKKKR